MVGKFAHAPLPTISAAAGEFATPYGAIAIGRKSRSPMPNVDRLRLREECQQDVVGDHEVLLLERGVCDARHHGELLVGVGQQLEELDEVVEAGDTDVLAAHDDATE